MTCAYCGKSAGFLLGGLCGRCTRKRVEEGNEPTPMVPASEVSALAREMVARDLLVARLEAEVEQLREKYLALPSWKDLPDCEGLWVEEWEEATTALEVFMIDGEPHHFDTVYRQNQGLCKCKGYRYFGPIPADSPPVNTETEIVGGGE